MGQGPDDPSLARYPDVLAGLSHELRAPLQSLLGHVDLLRRGSFGALTPAQAEALDSITRSAERVLAVARDVLQVARIDAGHEKVIVGQVDLADLVERELAAVRPLAAARGLALEDACAEGLTVVSDGQKIARILTNLLSNALKYTPAGRITVRGGRAGGRVFLEVEDTGIGIPEDRQEDVFLEYVRIEKTGEGTGLGLPIARRLAGLLCGTLRLRSRPGEGTAVRLELPV